MAEELITVTYEMTNDFATPNGGYTDATLEALGVKRDANGLLPLWRKLLVGKTITRQQYEAARAGRFIKVRKKRTRIAAQTPSMFG